MTVPITQYEAFEIRLRATPENRHELEVRSPVGSAIVDLGATLHKTMRSVPVAPRFRAGGPVRAGSESSEGRSTSHKWSPRVKGSALFESVFFEQSRALWRESLNRDSAGLGLCVRFHFDLQDPAQAQLAQIPWEMLYNEQAGEFLAHSVHTPVVRYLDVPGRLPKFALPDRLRVLGVISAPKDLHELSLLPEVDALRAQWQQDNVEVDVLQMPEGRSEPGFSEDLGGLLRRQLRNGEYHVLHFMGHGTFDTFTGEGSLYFEDETRGSVEISGSALAGWLKNHPSLRLVVLNACSSGRARDLRRPFAGVAQALIRAGTPGVLAMQEPMPDEEAIIFSRVFYRCLADGYPVEAALSEARLELHARNDRSDAWATPVLFQRTPEIVKVPPKIGPTLTRLWTIFGVFHLIWVLVLFLRNRSMALPWLDQMMTSDVAAFFGVCFGLPVFFFTLYLGLQHAEAVKLPGPEIGALRRLVLRLPVAFAAKIQGRRSNESVYQLLSLLLLVVVPMGFQIYLSAQLIRAQVWWQRGNVLFSSSLEEGLRKYVPPHTAFLNDNFRVGSIDFREHVVREINNVTYFPFWQPWATVIVEMEALAMCCFLLWRLLAPDPRFRPSWRGRADPESAP